MTKEKRQALIDLQSGHLDNQKEVDRAHKTLGIKKWSEMSREEQNDILLGR